VKSDCKGISIDGKYATFVFVLIYQDDQFELWWGQKQKLAYGMLAGDTTRLRITDMARKGMLHEGDLWRYSRTFKGSVTIKKELIVRHPTTL
jgi:hypothetical protein